MPNLSKSILLFIFSLNVSYCFSQTIQVVSNDNAPLPFATILNFNRSSIGSADEKGIFQSNAIKGDSLSVSFVGYKTTNLIFNGDKIQQVMLIQEKITLPTVNIEKCKKEKKTKYGNTDSAEFIISDNGEINHFGGVTWDLGYKNPSTKENENKNYLWAVRLNPEKENAHLINFSFWLEKPFGASSNYSITNPLILSFYDVEDSTDLPNHLISESSIIYYPKKSGKQTLNLDSLHLKIPTNGMYVAFHYVMNEKYLWETKSTWKDSSNGIGRDTIFYGYGSRIDGTYSTDFNLVNYNHIFNKWRFVSGFNKNKNDGKKHGTIKCEAVIKYCED